ncbi:putative RNA-directed DNA polymerase from transposon X-element [Stylophora pistillata]|uniref:Putative RNA-directed DNA polymerase from transposon X-element n=1 Tax=Stylophora pistillata TaxID=50429 RepID=A0A2B4SG94_STYPI|nr:putative RNA-directed DNA polymerase from transposon X-element [Stylophora pistillata]
MNSTGERDRRPTPALVWVWLHDGRTLNTAPVSFQAAGLDRPSFHFRRLSSFGLRRRPISSWHKHGYVCFLLPSLDLTICQDVERNPGPLTHHSTGRANPPPSAISLADKPSSQAQIATKFYSRTDLLRLRSSGPSYLYQSSLCLLQALGIFKYRGCRAGKADKARKHAVHNILPISSSRRDCRSLNIQLVTSNGVNPSVLKPLRSLLSSSLSSNNLRFAICNARSIRNKVETIIDHAVGNDIGICIFTETWLNDLDSVCIADLSRHGYLFKSFPRQSNRSGGGTGILFRDSFDATLLDGKEHNSFEFSEWILKTTNRSIRIVAVYRPPNSSASVFLDEFSSYLENIVMCPEPLIIAGDFNFHMDLVHSNCAIRFKELLETFSLSQHVTMSTHISGHILDLIITRSTSDLILGPINVTLPISDHFFVECFIRFPSSSISTKSVSYRRLKNIDIDAFKSDITSSVLCSDTHWSNLGDLSKQYSSTLTEILDKHAPIKTKTLVTRAKIPWFNADVLQFKRIRRKAERKALKSGLSSDWLAYRKICNRYSALLKSTRASYYSDLIGQCAGDSGKLFKLVSFLCKGPNVNDLPPHDDPVLLANKFGEFFVKKIELIKDSISDIEVNPPYSDTAAPAVELDSFSPLSVEDVCNIISTSSNASCSLDPIPTWLVKSCLDVLAPSITRMVNLSIRHAYVPDDWKTAIVKPLLKKPGLELTYKNFRPVSNLTFISKIVEKAVLSQLFKHCEYNAPLPKLQSGFRRFHSTETALLKVQSDILMSMDHQEITLLVLLDLSAAFDTIDHQILLNVLESDFGIIGSAHKWFASYLSGRKQRVLINDRTSDDFHLNCGVPQGSCMGPILFILYISRLYHVIANHLPSAHGYADDTQLYLSFRPNDISSQDHAIAALEACISDVRSWLIYNRLLINDSKTEFLVVGSRHQLSKIAIDSITVGNSTIQPLNSVRNLGSWFDSNMSMSIHIGKICSKAFHGLYKIRQIRKFLSPESTKTLVHAFVTSHLDYCNSLLFGVPKYQTERLQKVLNAAARLIFRIPKFHHISSALYNLHWLPVAYRVHFKLLLLIYKALNNQGPLYIKEYLQPHSVKGHQLRSCDQGLLKVPRTNFKTFGDRAFARSGPFLWNELPLEIRNSPSVTIFKSKLKTHLFKLAYSLF